MNKKILSVIFAVLLITTALCGCTKDELDDAKTLRYNAIDALSDSIDRVYEQSKAPSAFTVKTTSITDEIKVSETTAKYDERNLISIVENTFFTDEKPSHYHNTYIYTLKKDNQFHIIKAVESTTPQNPDKVIKTYEVLFTSASEFKLQAEWLAKSYGTDFDYYITGIKEENLVDVARTSAESLIATVEENTISVSLKDMDGSSYLENTYTYKDDLLAQTILKTTYKIGGVNISTSDYTWGEFTPKLPNLDDGWTLK